VQVLAAGFLLCAVSPPLLVRWHPRAKSGTKENENENENENQNENDNDNENEKRERQKRERRRMRTFETLQ
jgi:hypothetical protein